MRVRANILNGFTGTPIDKNGGVLTLPLLLVSGNPTNPLEAVTKQYVDNKVISIDSSQITGTFLAARLPAFTGTDVSSSGGGVITLSNTGVVPGSYCKVTVDSKGRVLSGQTLVAGDIPAFSWTKITSGKPTTLVGYGVTDGISTTGAVFTGSLYVTQLPTQSNQTANMQYVINRVAAVVGSGDYIYKVGDIVSRSATAAQSGYLRCNGALVSITAYATLFAAIGHISGNNPGGNNFYLPDLTTEERAGNYWFIKAT